MKALQRILVPTDFSENSLEAATCAREIAQRFVAQVHTLHVVEPVIVAPVLGEPLPASFVAERKRLAEKQLQDWSAVNHEAGLEAIDTLLYGSPFVEIVRYARENHIDLIVMGTHGRTGLAHAIIGSVAENVVRKASCSVLTVRMDGHRFTMP